MPYSKSKYRAYFQDRVKELQTINHAIWGFVGAAALLEYVTQLVNQGESSPTQYKDFFSSKYINPKYAAFTYRCGKQDLPIQMYHTYRCGVLHGFSLVPDSRGKNKGARDKSIVFSSLRYDQPLAASDNCKSYTDHGFDACRLVLEPFVRDIGIAINKIFDDSNLTNSIKKSATIHPPFNYYD